MRLTRRQMLARTTALAGISSVIPLQGMLRPEKKFYIGTCDWSIGKGGDPAAFDVAKKIGLDGVQVSLGSASNNMHLRNLALQQTYREASRRTGVKIASLAIGELNNIPYKSDPRAEEWVWDSIEVAKNLGVTVILLAFFNNNDLRNDAKGKAEVISRLKKVAPRAESMGVVLGIESYLNAAEHLEIIEKVGSPSIKVYYDFRNTQDAGFDTLQEMKKLGTQHICELHMKENGTLLQDGTLPWEKIRDQIYDMGYYGDGWMQIEWAHADGADIPESYRQNLRFLRNLFKKKL